MGHILAFLPLSPNNHSVRFGTFRDGTLFLNCRLNDDVALSFGGKTNADFVGPYFRRERDEEEGGKVSL